MRQYLGFLKGLLQDVVDILVNLVQLVLLDVALLQQPLGILLVGVLMRPDGLHTWIELRSGTMLSIQVGTVFMCCCCLGKRMCVMVRK